MPTCRLLVDADACPVRREAERAAERFSCPLILFANSSQKLAGDPMCGLDSRRPHVARTIQSASRAAGAGEKAEGTHDDRGLDNPRHSRMVFAGDGPDATDFRLFEECRSADLVITDDLGLAALALSKGARALSSRGRVYRNEEMPALLAGRHGARKARRAGRRTRGPSPFTDADRRRFVQALDALLSSPFHPKEPE